MRQQVEEIVRPRSCLTFAAAAAAAAARLEVEGAWLVARSARGCLNNKNAR